MTTDQHAFKIQKPKQQSMVIQKQTRLLPSSANFTTEQTGVEKVILNHNKTTAAPHQHVPGKTFVDVLKFTVHQYLPYTLICI